MNWLIRVVLLLAGAWLAWACLLYVAQRELLFVGAGFPALAAPAPPDAAWITLPGTTPAGRALWMRAARANPAPAILFAHGNGEFAAHNVAFFRPWVQAGFHVLMVEYPGYDDAPGAPSQPAIDALWLAAHDWLAAQPGVAPDRIVGMGRSLGSGPTSALAARRPLAAVVLQSGFASTMRFAQARGVPGALVRDRWDNVQALADFGGPVFASHGRFDDAIPPSHAEALRSLTNVQLEWLDCGHNDCPLDSAAYRTRVLAFLATAGVVPHDDGVVGTR